MTALGTILSSTDLTSAVLSDFGEAVDDRISTTLVGGTNVTLSYNDAANTVTINSAASGGSSFIDAISDTATIDLSVTGTTLSGQVVAGSITSSHINTSATPRVTRLGLGMVPVNLLDVTNNSTSLKSLNISHTLSSAPGALLYPALISGSWDTGHMSTGYAVANASLGVTMTTGYTTAPGSSSIGVIVGHAVSRVAVNSTDAAIPETAAAIFWTRDDTGAAATHPRVWGLDTGVHGTPRSEQQEMLANGVFFINNHYNGSPSVQDSVGVTITTRFAAGPATQAPHASTRTYPVDVGLAITGSAGMTGTTTMLDQGFKTGIRIGGHRTPWWDGSAGSAVEANLATKIGTGIEIMDFSTGIKIWKRTTGTTGYALELGLDSTGVASGSTADGIRFGGDVTLYRNTSQTLRVDLNFIVGGTFRHVGTTLGFYNAAAITKPTALTGRDSTVISTTTYGAPEAGVINNLRTRLNELESRLNSNATTGLGLIAGTA